jgi:hypothetical protein
MHIIISPAKVPFTNSKSSSEFPHPIVLQKQKELLNMFTSGLASFNYCMAEMYKIGKIQGERR